jgi:hypothetical protein
LPQVPAWETERLTTSVRRPPNCQCQKPSTLVPLNGLQDDAPVGPRWNKLAYRKILEVDQSIRRSRRLKSLLEHLLHCRCISLEVCMKCLSLSPKLRLIGRGTKSLSNYIVVDGPPDSLQSAEPSGSKPKSASCATNLLKALGVWLLLLP